MVKVPQERIGCFTKEIRKKIEGEIRSKLEIEKNDVEVLEAQGLKKLTVKRIIKAIGRGFDPEIALLLSKPNYKLEMLKVNDYAHTDNSIRRLKGRVIGREGKIKKRIENKAKVYLSIYGKTIGIIGENMHVGVARKTIIRLLKGCEHSTAFKSLSNSLRGLNRRSP